MHTYVVLKEASIVLQASVQPRELQGTLLNKRVIALVLCHIVITLILFLLVLLLLLLARIIVIVIVLLEWGRTHCGSTNNANNNTNNRTSQSYA